MRIARVTQMLDPDALLNWRGDLAPGQARTADGALLLGGIPASALAQAYGTPLLAIDMDVLDACVADFTRACTPHGIEIAYAGKALLLIALARYFAETSLHLDVCSLGELATAERAAFPSERMTLHGCGKPDDELDAAAAGRVGTIVADSVEELERLRARASDDRSINVLVRVNTGIEAHTHELVRTGGENTKFGVPERELDAVIALLRGAPGLTFGGLHSHIGSQIYESAAFVANASALVDVAARFHRAGLPSAKLIIGGGFGVQSDPHGARTVPIRETIDAMAEAASAVARKAGIPLPRLAIEPGRALMARAGTSIYRVMARKDQGTRTFVVVDGSLADNPRHALYDAYHHIVAASPHGGATGSVTVCGRSCENDVLGEAILPEALHAGDLVAMCTAGAYTYSMASNYNRFAKPAVVALRGGSHRPIARRQTFDEVLQNDCDA